MYKTISVHSYLVNPISLEFVADYVSSADHEYLLKFTFTALPACARLTSRGSIA